MDPQSSLQLFRGVSQGGWDPQENNFHLYTIVIGAQALHATGYAMGVRMDGNVGTGDPDRDTAVICYFGDGASSQGDVNEAFVYAASFDAPVVFFCQNNQWAISEPVEKQTRIPLFQRARGFGFPGVRVDGNDILATYAVTQHCLDEARNGNGPLLIEAYTYRMGAHTTADDPTKYRVSAEVEEWKFRDPILRLKTLLAHEGMADEAFFAARRRGGRPVRRRAARGLRHDGDDARRDDVGPRLRRGPPRHGGGACRLPRLQGELRGGELMALEKVTLGKSITNGLRKAMEADPKVVLIGEDIGKLGGVFRITEGLDNAACDFLGPDIVFVFAWLPFVLAGADGQPSLSHAIESRLGRGLRRGPMTTRSPAAPGAAVTRGQLLGQALGAVGAATLGIAAISALAKGSYHSAPARARRKGEAGQRRRQARPPGRPARRTRPRCRRGLSGSVLPAACPRVREPPTATPPTDRPTSSSASRTGS